MTTVLIVADPDLERSLRDSLASLDGVEITVASTDDAYRAVAAAPSGGFAYAVLHDTPFKDGTAKDLYEVVGALRERRIPTAVLFDRIGDDDLKKAVFVPYVDVGIDLGEHGERRAEAIARVTLSVATLSARPAAIPPSALRIGSLVEVGFETNSASDGETNKPGTAYRMARWRSLLPLNGTEFPQDVRDVVTALAPFPLRGRIPWDPREHKGSPEWPSIKDVFRTFTDQETFRALFGSESPPLTQAEAVGLLAGERAKGEDATAHAAWFAAWDGGANKPPAVLIEGDTGVGKSLMAEFITFLLTPTRTELREQRVTHQGITGRDRFVKFNAAAVTMTDVNHHLLGAAPGIWSGIDDAVVGQLARAAHGVFLLDEVGEMPLDVQAALLTFLDSREIRPMGVEPFYGFQHIIAATNRNLAADVADASFRKDLLARFPLRLRIPALAERSLEDRRRLVDFLAQDPSFNPRRGDTFEVEAIEEEAVTQLISHDYTNGNFRELAQRVHESIRRTRRGLRHVVRADDVPEPEAVIATSGSTGSLRGPGNGGAA